LPTWGSPVRARSRAPENVNALGWLGRGRFRNRGRRSREGPYRAGWVQVTYRHWRNLDLFLRPASRSW